MLRNSVRIVGGVWRSRQIRLTEKANIRPTPDRVRETLFNWLAPVIEGAYCLDLFAGSGALGLEALSRGAAWVGFIERSYVVFHALRQQIDQFKATDRSCVYHQSYRAFTEVQLSFHKVSQRSIDVVFLDPPFRQNLMIESVEWVVKQAFLSSNVYLYMEYEKELILPEFFTSNWQCWKQQQAGQINYGLWVKRDQSLY